MKITFKMPDIPKNFFQKIGAVLGLVMFFFGLWQMDMICVGPVWGYNWVATDYLPPHRVIPRFADGFFQMGWAGIGINMNIGLAYDLCQIFLVIGLLVAFFALWLWNEQPNIEKIQVKAGEDISRESYPING